MRLLFCLAVLLGAGRVWAQPQVSGRVTDHAGSSVANGRIRAVPLTPGPGLAPQGALRNVDSVATGADGSFALSGLQAGIYRLCAHAPGRELLDPCQWDRTPVPVVVGDRPMTGRMVQLKRGATLTIRLNDPAKALAAAERSGKGHLLVGVWSANGVFQPARITAEDPSGRTYSLEVPVGVTARVSLTPAGLGLRDSAGNALAGGASVDLDVQPAGNGLTYSVAAP